MIPFVMGMAMASESFTAGLSDELSELYPDSVVSEKTPAKYEIDVPRGSYAGVHVLLNGLKAGQEVKVSGGGKTGKWYRLIDVPVELNAGTSGWTEKVNGQVNPNVIRRAPFRIYDALEPLEGDVFTPKDPTAALRFEVPIMPVGKPGAKAFRLTLRQGDAAKSLTFRVRVRDAVVPPVGKDSIGFTNWWAAGNVAKYSHVEPWSEGYWTVLGRYADLMARARQNTILTPWSLISAAREVEDALGFDFSRFDLDDGTALDITSVFEAVGACARGTITEDELGDIERAVAAGCDDYDTKPVDFPRLLKLIEKFLGPQ